MNNLSSRCDKHLFELHYVTRKEVAEEYGLITSTVDDAPRAGRTQCRRSFGYFANSLSACATCVQWR